MKRKEKVDSSRKLVASRTMTQHKHEEATPQPTPAKVPYALLQKFHKQRKEVDELGAKCLARTTTKVKKKTRAKKPIRILVEMESPGHEIIGMPRQMKTTPQEAFGAMETACFRDAASAFLSAQTALKEGRIEDFYDHLFSTEGSLGAAEAWSGVDKIISVIASTKAVASQEARGTYTVKKRVLDFWLNNIDPQIPASQAATIIDERYLSKPGEISYATLCEWISAEKKKSTRFSQTPSLPTSDAPVGRLISPKPPRRP